MTRKKLNFDEMLDITGNWIDPQSDANKAILALPELAPSLPRITKVHNELSINAQPQAENPRVDQISNEQASLDNRHDDVIRGSHLVLTGIALLLGPEHGAPILALRDNFIPDGLSSVQKTYRAESGQATQLEERLTPEKRAVTSKIHIDPEHPTHSFTDFLDEWIQLGKQIGTLEDEKALLAPAELTPGTLLTARNKWIRTVTLFLAVAEAAELDPATYALIFNPLLLAEENAANRGAKPAPAPETPAEPVVNPT